MSNLFRVVFVAIFLAFIPRSAEATAQVPDTIIIDGKEYALNTNPLESYLGSREWIPPKEALVSTANWRGYIATWAIDEDRLVLKDATIRIKVESDVEALKSILTDLFPRTPKVVADWYTGTLVIPDGEMTEYVHMGYGSTYDHYQIIRISSGRVIERLSMNGVEFNKYKNRKFEEFTKSDEYKKARADLLKRSKDRSEDAIRDFMQSFYAEDYLTR